MGRYLSAFYEWLSVRGQMNLVLRTIANHYGRAYWRLPRVLRRRICWERHIPNLMGAEKFEVGAPEIAHPIAGEPGTDRSPPTFGHRLAAQGFRTPQPFVARLSRAWLVGRYATPVTPDGNLLLTGFRDAPRIFGLDRHHDLEAWLSAGRWKDSVTRPVIENVWPMVNRLESNYFHWIVEWCGRLEWLESYSRKTGVVPCLLIPQNGPGYIRSSLELLGYRGEDVLEWRAESPPQVVKNLLVPSFRGTTGATSPIAMRWLRNRFLKNAEISEINPWRKIYIPRRPGGWRGVLNSAEVEECLREMGFDIFEPHLLSMLEQIRIFSEAHLIVGLHGSGLTNILFAPQAMMLELLGTYGDGVWFGMTTRLGQKYESMSCQAVGEDVAVDVEALRRRVNAMVAKRVKNQPSVY